jgi:hypothetical protein
MPLVHGLAAWERYVRAAAANLDGIPTFAADFDTVLADPVSWTDSLVHFLHQVGVEVDPDRRATAEAFLSRELRHQQGASESAPGPVAGARLVLEELRQRQGTHLPWRAPDLGEEPAWVGEVLTMAQELETLRIAIASLHRSRAVRVITGLWKTRAALTRRPSG